MDGRRLPAPEAQLLSNGRYRVLVTESGGGYAEFGELALTRWAADTTRDADGIVIYVRDLDTRHYWSAGCQPAPGPSGRCIPYFNPGTAAIVTENDGIGTRLDVVVSPRHPLELRRITLTNRSSRARRLEVTTYAEPVLATQAADLAHPAFSKLFIRTAFLPGPGALLAARRARGPGEPEIRLAHALVREGTSGSETPQCETDRMRFIGRSGTGVAPAALRSPDPLSGTVGDVLDPILSLRRVVVLEPDGRASLRALFASGSTDQDVADLLAVGSSPGAWEQALAGAARRARKQLRALGITGAELIDLPRIAGAIAYALPPAGTRRFDESGAADAAPLGLPAGVPFFYAIVRTRDDLPALRTIGKALAWWRAQGNETSLLVLKAPTLGSEEEVAGAVAVLGRHVSVHDGEEIAPPMRHLALNAMQVLGLASHPPPSPRGRTRDPAWARARSLPSVVASSPRRAEALRLFNGYGGFSEDGTEYVIRLTSDGDGHRRPPLPWINVVANEQAGFLVSESGAGATWTVNSRENRLTPWFNDPVSDPHGEALYLRDEDAGVFWSPTPGPSPGAGAYDVRHGFGYTRFVHQGLGIDHDLVLFVPRHDPVKLGLLRLTNRSDRPRRLSILAYFEWVLGTRHQDTARWVVTGRDEETGALLARNPASDGYGARVAFATVVAPRGATVQATADRSEFLGRRGDVAHPEAAITGADLLGRTGPDLHPCAAFRTRVEIGPGEGVEYGILLGQGEHSAAALDLVRRYRDTTTIQSALDGVKRFWHRLVSAVQVETPSPAIDLMVNGWLTYQNVSCRLWGRSALYQSGGAFGFRDQLQDAAALVYASPELTRRQIVLHAAHQFVEGDVLHWWHPPTGKGIRTRCSDDLLWLPYVTASYVRATGDASVLDEEARFVRARALQPDEDEAFLVPEPAEECATVYGHCCRALDRSLTRGRHGLPLIGTGDWNDGLNRVGRLGLGESVWLGFFLHAVLGAFIPLCERRGETARAARYREQQTTLATALNGPGWDGAWYRRGFYDDGTPLGSAASDECRIDAIAQAWGVLSGVAPPDRAAQALDALERHLVGEREGIIRLFTPPFARTAKDPGYIKGYPPGVRENGGQYTHGALWAVRALAESGRASRAAHLLEMLSPVSHAATPEAAAAYGLEPYVVAADVYGVPPHLGRGGWSWYTGSAGWMFRVAVESILGVTLRGGSELLVRPCVPPEWPGYTVRYRLPNEDTIYEIVVRRTDTRTGIAGRGDGARVEDGAVVVPLRRDGRSHRVEIELGG